MFKRMYPNEIDLYSHSFVLFIRDYWYLYFASAFLAYPELIFLFQFESDARRFRAFRAHKHQIRKVQRRGNGNSLAFFSLPLGPRMLFYKIQAFNNGFPLVGRNTHDFPDFPSVFSGQYFHIVAFNYLHAVWNT